MFTPTIDGDDSNICHRVGGKSSSPTIGLEVILVGIDDDPPLFLALLEWLKISFTEVSITPFDYTDLRYSTRILSCAL